MNKIINAFVSPEENLKYKFRIGRAIASPLAGFVFGVIIASFIWFVAMQYLEAVVLEIIASVRY